MNQPCLIAATPRAGRWNHRFLVPPQTSFSEAEVAHWADEARRSDVGPDYLAAVRQGVVQQASGRSGIELLILVALPIERLSESDRSRIQENLTRRLDELERLVLDGIDWERNGRQVLVPRQELQQWYEKDVASVLQKAPGRLISMWQKRNQPWVAVMLVVILCVLGFMFMGDDLLESLKHRFASQTTEKNNEAQVLPSDDLAIWASAVGIETGDVPASELAGRLADKLEEKLFFLKTSHDPKAPRTPAEDQTRLQQRLKALYDAGDFPETKEGLRELLAHKELRERIETVLAEKDSDRFVFIKRDPNPLKELVPRGTRDEVQEFPKTCGDRASPGPPLRKGGERFIRACSHHLESRSLGRTANCVCNRRTAQRFSLASAKGRGGGRRSLGMSRHTEAIKFPFVYRMAQGDKGRYALASEIRETSGHSGSGCGKNLLPTRESDRRDAPKQASRSRVALRREMIQRMTEFSSIQKPFRRLQTQVRFAKAKKRSSRSRSVRLEGKLL